MKVIKDNYKKFPIEVTCEKCGSIIKLEGREDIILNEYTCEQTWNCCLCGMENQIEDEI